MEGAWIIGPGSLIKIDPPCDALPENRWGVYVDGNATIPPMYEPVPLGCAVVRLPDKTLVAVEREAIKRPSALEELAFAAYEEEAVASVAHDTPVLTQKKTDVWPQIKHRLNQFLWLVLFLCLMALNAYVQSL